jgi:hypothetical protein
MGMDTGVRESSENEKWKMCIWKNIQDTKVTNSPISSMQEVSRLLLVGMKLDAYAPFPWIAGSHGDGSADDGLSFVASRVEIHSLQELFLRFDLCVEIQRQATIPLGSRIDRRPSETGVL